jgi:DNA repair exonuclease SbcCD nuclease subunit
MHVKKENIEESSRVIDWIIQLCQQHDALPVFMGDQYDTMAIKRVEVEEFWYEAYEKIDGKLGRRDGISSISVTGNHDLNSDGSASAMTVHKKQTHVISAMGKISSELYAIGYVRDNQEFIKCAEHLYGSGAKVILCHAEFNGAEYENGFYAPHGIDLEKCPPVTFISGHIHKSQKLQASNGAVVLYTGTPRHLTRSDAGQVKGVWLMDGTTVDMILTPSAVAEPFVQILIQEGADLGCPVIPSSGRVYVDIKGSKDFVSEMTKKMPEGARVRTFVDTEVVKSEIKESDGVNVAFKNYLDKYFDNEKIPTTTRDVISQELLSQIGAAK